MFGIFGVLCRVSYVCWSHHPARSVSVLPHYYTGLVRMPPSSAYLTYNIDTFRYIRRASTPHACTTSHAHAHAARREHMRGIEIKERRPRTLEEREAASAQ